MLMKTNTFNPFLFYSNQLKALLTKASTVKNPSQWLFQNNARTVLFMMEALTRLHNNAFDEKLFSKWSKRFKKLEDSFGEIDSYYWLYTEFKGNKQIDKELTNYFLEKYQKRLEKLDEYLLKKEWLENKLDKFDTKLNKYVVEYNKDYINELSIAISEEIESITFFVEKIDFSFTKFEEEVHELRRKLRWLSIYGQALNGLAQLKKGTKPKKYKQNYFTKEILASPYNKLPKKPANTAVLELDHDAFLALSWIISELGKYKDIGLKCESLCEATFKLQDITSHQAKLKSLKALGLEENAEEEMLKKVSEFVKVFFQSDKILEKLLVK